MELARFWNAVKNLKQEDDSSLTVVSCCVAMTLKSITLTSV